MINATTPSPFHLGQNTTTPHMWTVFFNDQYEIISMRIHLDPSWYPNEQSPPPTTNYTILNFSSPPSRDYDGCVGKLRNCLGYDKPFSSKQLNKNLIYQQILFLVLNMSIYPNMKISTYYIMNI